MSKRVSALGLVIGSMLALHCSRAPTLLVTVENLPPAALSLQVIATHDGKAAIKDLEPFPLPTPSPAIQTFLLHMPSSFGGDVAINVGVFDKPNGAGCLLGTGVGTLKNFEGTDNLARVTITRFEKPECNTGPAPTVGGPFNPVVLSAVPRIGLNDGNETITLHGWGFKPGATVKLGSKAATEVTYISASEIQVKTPSRAGFGLVPVQVTNPDSTTAKRSDIFRFYTNTLRFTALSVLSDTDYATTAAFAVGQIAKETPTELDAALLFKLNNVPTLRVIRTNGTATLDKFDYPITGEPGGLSLVDLNNDGFKDFVVVSAGSKDNLRLFINDGTGHFPNPGVVSVLGEDKVTPLNITGLSTTDFDGDGSVDLAMIATDSNSVAIYQNNGTGSFRAGSIVTSRNKPVSISVGDINGDKQPDIAVANSAPQGADYNFTGFFNQGGGRFATSGSGRVEPPVSGAQSTVSIRDINYDGLDDMVIVLPALRQVVVYLQGAGFLNFTISMITTSLDPRGLTLADINGDGYDDLLIAGYGEKVVEIFLNDRGNGFTGVTSTKVQLPKAPTQVATVDFNSDGLADVGVLVSDGVVGLVNQSGGN